MQRSTPRCPLSRPRSAGVAPEGDGGSIALLSVLGGAVVLLVLVVPLVVVVDLLVTRGRAQTAADAAALAAMGDAGGAGGDGAHDLARVNGGDVLACCGDDPARRQVTVGVAPASILLAAVVPQVQAAAAAALVGAGSVTGMPAGPVGPGGRVWPVAAPATSGFGMRAHPLTGTPRLHVGIDLGAPAGTPIRAAAAGTVVFAGTMGGYGNTVDIRHGDGTTTRYAHQSRILIRSGQQVAAGQVIGLVGSTGASTGPHLHLEVRTSAGPIDPHTWLPH